MLLNLCISLWLCPCTQSENVFTPSLAVSALVNKLRRPSPAFLNPTTARVRQRRLHRKHEILHAEQTFTNILYRLGPRVSYSRQMIYHHRVIIWLDCKNTNDSVVGINHGRRPNCDPRRTARRKTCLLLFFVQNLKNVIIIIILTATK